MAKNKKDICPEDLSGLSYQQVNELLAKKGNYIQFIENPTDEQCKIAVRQNGYAIRHIKHQSPELIDIAITTSPLSSRNCTLTVTFVMSAVFPLVKSVLMLSAVIFPFPPTTFE